MVTDYGPYIVVLLGIAEEFQDGLDFALRRATHRQGALRALEEVLLDA